MGWKICDSFPIQKKVYFYNFYFYGWFFDYPAPIVYAFSFLSDAIMKKARWKKS